MSVTSMYNKLFTKILDSSIWLESAPTRLVWLTMIAAMDEEGMVLFASVQNLAHRARVPLKDAEAAVKCLESPDPNSSDPENEGRRIERVPGGWIILNAPKYRELVTRTIIREKTRVRVAKFRANKASNAPVTPENVTVTEVTPPKHDVTPSDTKTDTDSKADSKAKSAKVAALPLPADLDTPEFREAWEQFMEHRRQKRKPLTGMAAEMQLRNLLEMGVTRAVAAIRYSIAQGWQGIFEPNHAQQKPAHAGEYPENIPCPIIQP